MTENPSTAEDTGADTTAEKPKAPFLTVVKGNPDDVQVATLTALFATMANNAANQAEAERDRNMWGNLEERLRRPMAYNPTAFRNVSFY